LPLSGVSNEVADLRRPPAAEMAEDLRRAKQALENRLGKTVQHMAFPQYDGTESAIHIACDVGYQGLWWGVLPGRPLNRPKGPPDHIVRISGEFVRRMPGDGRAKLRDLARARYGGRP
jgi:hypothetical protein